MLCATDTTDCLDKWIKSGQGHHKTECCVDRISEDTHSKSWVPATCKGTMADCSAMNRFLTRLDLAGQESEPSRGAGSDEKSKEYGFEGMSGVLCDGPQQH